MLTIRNRDPLPILACLALLQVTIALVDLRLAGAADQLPVDQRVLYNQACELAEQGKWAEAESLLERSKLAGDPAVAAASRYNLGRIAAERARATFGERPEEADNATRSRGLAQIEQAIQQFRDCTQLSPQHADSLHNIEVLRLWTQRMKNEWNKRDRERPSPPDPQNTPQPAKPTTQQPPANSQGKQESPGKAHENRSSPSPSSPSFEDKSTPRTSAQRQAEAILRHARLREQLYREKQKLRAGVARGGAVEKDW